jgi:hypothetical protein
VAFVSGTGRPPHAAGPQWRTPDVASAPWYLWRLLSSNNRELGRSAATFLDLDAAVESVDRVRHALSCSELFTVRVSAPARWRWELHLEDAVVACGSRTYQRLRECQSSADGFRACLTDAAIQAHPSQLVHQRRLHAPALALLGPVSGSRR